MTIVDGKKIAENLYTEIAAKVKIYGKPIKMAIVTCAPNFETRKYLELKKRKADEVGIGLVIVEVEANASTGDIVNSIKSLTAVADGIVVQLPLPEQVDTTEVLAAVPVSKDPDCFAGNMSQEILPPVVGAVRQIANVYDIDWYEKSVTVVGYGRLVGKPVSAFITKQGGNVTILTEDSTDLPEVVASADIIVTGVGKPGLITKDMVKEGVVVFDAGTSEQGGELRGDVAEEVSEKAALYTPVPGGVGPVTVAVLLHNLVLLASQ